MDNGAYLFAGFAAVWAVTFGYILYQETKIRRLQREMNNLKVPLNSGKKSSER